MASGGKTTSQAGYGSAHQNTRADLKPLVDAGMAWCCEVVCINPAGRWIPPDLPGRPTGWHLAHTADRSGYRGPAHAACNTSEAGKRGNPRGKPKRAATAPVRWRPTRAW